MRLLFRSVSSWVHSSRRPKATKISTTPFDGPNYLASKRYEQLRTLRVINLWMLRFWKNMQPRNEKKGDSRESNVARRCQVERSCTNDCRSLPLFLFFPIAQRSRCVNVYRRYLNTTTITRMEKARQSWETPRGSNNVLASGLAQTAIKRFLNDNAVSSWHLSCPPPAPLVIVLRYYPLSRKLS